MNNGNDVQMFLTYYVLHTYLKNDDEGQPRSKNMPIGIGQLVGSFAFRMFSVVKVPAEFRMLNIQVTFLVIKVISIEMS